jgi:hypothetical protein
VLLGVHCVALSPILKENFKLFVQRSGLWRLLPHVVPVNVCGCRGTCPDNIQNILGSVQNMS